MVTPDGTDWEVVIDHAHERRDRDSTSRGTPYSLTRRDDKEPPRESPFAAQHSADDESVHLLGTRIDD